MSEKHVPAFREKLVVSEFEKPFQPFDKLHEFESDKRFVVRKFDTDLLDAEKQLPLEGVASIFRESLKELETTYDIVSPTHFVIAEDENKKPSLYILTERVAPVSYEDADSLQKEKMAKGIGDIFRSLMKYYEEKYTTQDRYLSDLPDIGQYVYGKKDGTVEERWYLVDADPYYSKDKENLLEIAETLEDEISDIETKFGIDLSDIKVRAETLHAALVQDLGYEG